MQCCREQVDRPQHRSRNHTKHVPEILGLGVVEAPRLIFIYSYRIGNRAAVNDALVFGVM